MASTVGHYWGHGLLLSPVTSARASASSLCCPPASALGGHLVSISHLHSCRFVFLGLWALRDRLWFRIGIFQPLPTKSFYHFIQGNERKSLIRLPIRVFICGCSLSNLTSEKPFRWHTRPALALAPPPLSFLHWRLLTALRWLFLSSPSIPACIWP